MSTKEFKVPFADITEAHTNQGDKKPYVINNISEVLKSQYVCNYTYNSQVPKEFEKEKLYSQQQCYASLKQQSSNYYIIYN